MNYVIGKDFIRVNLDTFDPLATLNSGQMFRYGILDSGDMWLSSGANYATIQKENGDYVIHTQNPKYFVNFFDLDTNYPEIIKALSQWPVLQPALDYSRGVRMLKQDLIEVIISFIISANNNIPRIKKAVDLICTNFGEKCSWGYAFPSLTRLASATEKDFASYGCGYRAPYLVETISALKDTDILDRLISAPDTVTARQLLLSLKGVGPKVADCILLFGLNRYDVFPVDTWIEKVYKDEFRGTEKSRVKQSKFFVETFRDLSGYCQQYLFYYKRKDVNK